MKEKLWVIIVTLFLLILPVSHVHAEEIDTTDKLIAIDIGKQMLYAWEEGRIIYQTPVSTGLPLSPTRRGKFKIYLKYDVQPHMRGYSPYKGSYDLPKVPHVMYYSGNYSIHGTYWHNNFGRPASNGCVNVPLESAKWLYDFAPQGTQVVIY